MAVSMWPEISHLSISKPELINFLRQMGQQVKWPQKMKAPDFLWNPNEWCDFHKEHCHKTKDCVALRIEVNELLKKGHLREFLSEKAKSHLNKETTNQPTQASSASPPRQDRVIHVISGGSEISGVSHAASKKSTRIAKNGQKIAKLKLLLLGTDEISFTAKEQEKVLAPHHVALVISLELPGFSGEIKQTMGEVLSVYAKGFNMSTKFLVVNCKSSYNMILGRPLIHDMGPSPQHFTRWLSFLPFGA
ncbi:hypothetical protein N665_0024s0021 [Sinapis alba]|nr:hypothetical protein N665_0024s0021 [Sinapis alba]